jgi:hypothetical protein
MPRSSPELRPVIINRTGTTADLPIEAEPRSEKTSMTFAHLFASLLEITRWRIANGAFTERGLAKKMAYSQPQVHNLLKGSRRLSPTAADKLLAVLGLTVEDLISGRGQQWPRIR